MSKTIKLICLICLISCSNSSIEAVSTAHNDLIVKSGGNTGGNIATGGATNNIGGNITTGGIPGTGGTTNTNINTGGIPGSGGTTNTGGDNTGGCSDCWKDTQDMPFGNDTARNNAAALGAEDGWTGASLKGCVAGEVNVFCQAGVINWPGGMHMFCAQAAAWASARACVSVEAIACVPGVYYTIINNICVIMPAPPVCVWATGTACAYAYAYAYAWACAGAK